MKNIKSQFVFNKQQRIGVFLLVLLIVALQLVYFTVDFSSDDKGKYTNEELFAFQEGIDSITLANKKQERVIHPFNPNFISDYKGYVLGMSTEEIDRLHVFRKQNKYVNSSKEFQQVTQLSDSLLSVIAPYFKFPDWVVKRQQENYKKAKEANSYNRNLNTTKAKDLVRAVELDYKMAYRVVNFRDKLGGFVSMDQLLDVYDLSPKNVLLIRKKFQLKTIPEIQKININLADVSELASIVYINNSLAQSIVDERLLREGFKSLDELKFVERFPEEKLERIKLYLTLK